ncbi:uncharacterized protein LOC141605383 isoform X2 [Silene latifolia]|uniref:uncharacterized protein LOC141605383 isoform X2 n=2 Tax=Silene latifolia TaxID=37657 RepID=UPI003D78A1D2
MEELGACFIYYLFKAKKSNPQKVFVLISSSSIIHTRNSSSSAPLQLLFFSDQVYKVIGEWVGLHLIDLIQVIVFCNCTSYTGLSKMKLEKDHVLGIQSPPRKSYNPFDSDDEVEATSGPVKSNLNGYDIKSLETNADSLTFHLDSSDVSWEEAILNHSQILSRSNPADSNGDEVITRKDTEHFTDKTVAVCDLPDLMVCYKESTCHIVKDIGIDEGMPVHDKVSIKSRVKHGEDNTPTFLGLVGDINEDEHLKTTFTEGLKSRPENNLENDVSSRKWPRGSDSIQDRECGIDDLTNMDEPHLNSSKEQSSFSMETTENVVDNGKEVLSSSESQLDEKDDSNYHSTERNEQVFPEENGKYAFSSEQTRDSSTMVSITETDAPSIASNESVYEETTSSLSPDVSALEESSDSGLANVFSYNSKVESGSIVLDFNSTTPKEKEEEKISEETETIEKPPEAQSMSRIDGEPSTDSGTENRVHGETSFSAVMAPPAAITYMGPFAHTGNISLRSESSAGSTRSFAFPVLQAEWNSSPVRMAKAEHRNRKQRGWVHSVMCCRF